jgi:hypothetical protein
VVRLPSTHEPRPMWPRWVAASGGLVALIVTTSAITAAPSAQTLASTAGSSLPAVPTHGAVVRPNAAGGDDLPASPDQTASEGVATPKASGASAVSPAADTESDAGAPAAVAAVPTSASEIRLEWAAVTGASRYRIQRSSDSLTWDPVGSTDGGETIYTDKELTAGTTYYYRVVAFVDGQDASSSDAVSATTSVDTSTPPVLTSATGSATSIELKWTGVGGEVGYRIERSLDGAGDWIAIGTTGQGVTTYTDTGLASMTSYDYRVIAVTPDGETSPSTPLSGTTGPGAPSTSEADGTVSEPPEQPKDPNG